ncbi:unnamed protein product [Spirodela intermedia]|uniref:BHLH domain-containing protein n=1 Tax=Spirodela intermedia TaxID=51605 RepID=A0A7I8J9J9_SPIIN|nr:unnamed protein product [Spirodela intermedia]CAA6666769.1 unnamed protein product [Spirodela intermedia]
MSGMDHRRRRQLQSSCRDEEPRRITAPAANITVNTSPAVRRGAKSEEKRKRSAEDKQRRRHIAAERNRRMMMNLHFSSLCSLLPPSFLQRGDQASIVGGTIDFIKVMEQLLQTLLAEKRMRSGGASTALSPLTVAAHSLYAYCPSNQDTTFTSIPQSTAAPREEEAEDQFDGSNGGGDPTTVADVEATVVQSQVTIRVLSRRRPGQLVRAAAELEKVHLSVLHLSVTSFTDAVLCSLILKMEEDCELTSADEIATVVHEIFSSIATCG